MAYTTNELEHYNHRVGINFWHMNWQTKYQYKMFGKFEYKNLCEASIRKAAFRHSIKIRLMRVLPDHVHSLLTLPRGMTEIKAMQILKGCSSYTFFKNHPKARLRYKEIFRISCSKNFLEIFCYPQRHLWSRGGSAVTVGYNQLSETEQYILNQAKHHGLA